MLDLSRDDLILAENSEESLGHLLVASCIIECRIVVDDLQVLSFVGRRRNRQRSEELLDLCLKFMRVDVTYDNDSLVGRVIPFMVIVAQTVAVAVVYDVHVSDDRACAITTVREQSRQRAQEQTLCSVMSAVFVVDDVALIVELALVKCQTFRPVTEQKQTAVECALTLVAHAVDMIDGVVRRCVGIPLSTETVHELRHSVAGEMFRAVERHVLEEVSQTILIILFLDSTHTLGDVEVHFSLRIVVVADVIGQSIVKMAYDDRCVLRDEWHLLCLCWVLLLSKTQSRHHEQGCD